MQLNINEKFALEGGLKAHKMSRDIALPFL